MSEYVLLPFVNMGKKDFVEFKGKKYYKDDLKDGEGLTALLQLGYDLIEMHSIVNLKPKTIEKRIFEYTTKVALPNLDEIFEIMLQDKCFPRVQLFKDFCKSKFNAKKICRLNNIKDHQLEEIIDDFMRFSLAREMLKKRSERIEEFRKNNETFPYSYGVHRSKSYKIS